MSKTIYASGNKVIRMFLENEPFSGTISSYTIPNGGSIYRKNDYIDLSCLNDYIGCAIWVYRNGNIISIGKLEKVGKIMIEYSDYDTIDCSKKVLLFSTFDQDTLEEKEKTEENSIDNTKEKNQNIVEGSLGFIRGKYRSLEERKIEDLVLEFNTNKKLLHEENKMKNQNNLTQLEKEFIEKTEKEKGCKIIVNNNSVVVKYGFGNKKTSIAHCHPDDQFDLVVGYEVALAKIKREKKRSSLKEEKEILEKLKLKHKKEIEEQEKMIKERERVIDQITNDIKHPKYLMKKIEEEKNKNKLLISKKEYPLKDWQKSSIMQEVTPFPYLDTATITSTVPKPNWETFTQNFEEFKKICDNNRYSYSYDPVWASPMYCWKNEK